MEGSILKKKTTATTKNKQKAGRLGGAHTLETEAGLQFESSEFESQASLCSEFQATEGYIVRPCFQ